MIWGSLESWHILRTWVSQRRRQDKLFLSEQFCQTWALNRVKQFLIDSSLSRFLQTPIINCSSMLFSSSRLFFKKEILENCLSTPYRKPSWVESTYRKLSKQMSCHGFYRYSKNCLFTKYNCGMTFCKSWNKKRIPTTQVTKVNKTFRSQWHKQLKFSNNFLLQNNWWVYRFFLHEGKGFKRKS